MNTSNEQNHEFFDDMKSVQKCGISFTQNSRFRRSMEDAHIVVDNFGEREDQGFFAIYDGHGGNKASSFCKDTVHEEFLRLLKEKQPLNSEKTATIPEIFSQTFSNIDTKLKEENPKDSGSTAVVSFIRKEEESKFLYTSNIGDARAVICRDGVAKRLSEDHKASVKSEQERIQKAGGFVFNNRVVGMIAITRSFGDHSMKEMIINTPYNSKIELKESDSFLILACDGLWDVVDDQKAVDLVKDMNDPLEMSKKLLNSALEGGSTDNISIMIIML
ncbi:hypothetical protein M0813_05142 [Anaeramoeba flamelloides]|uniref:PPM-type phosphatase domain-containing protein n=1 Tax=Anaeramoeba flamelloides TaxID=1746091 RepID=A0AAV7YED1_9EUKA|nr:hypothetical protein M0812_26584 [Anaeramoeba flamelloides]KAJ6232221.1 hypothetical protein M0813_05142 [Anaeramoeba flamelloides]